MTNFQKNVLFKKNIILIPADYDGISNQKGVLTLEFFNDKVLGTIRCYNLKPTDEIYSVGVSVGDNAFKTKASAKELENLKLEINASSNNNSKISCVIVKLNEKSYTTLLWGSTETTKAMEKTFYVENLLYKTKILESQEQNFNERNEVLSQSQINEKQDEIFEDEMLENYIDKVVAETETNSENSYQQNTAKSNIFFDKISNQVDMMFEQNEPENILENIIPNSKFCKVSNGENFYVFGVINENGSPKCLCYGIPSEYSSVPPDEVDGYCQWLPLDINNYKGKGYWMTYQDAITGENISVEIVS